MSPDGPSVLMKFSERLNRFIRFRKLGRGQIEALLRDAKPSNRESYRKLIVNATVVNFLQEIAPTLFGNDHDPRLGPEIENELYQLAVKVNPALDINEVTIACDEGRDTAAGLPMLDAQYHCPAEPVAAAAARARLLEEELARRIVGQDDALASVTAIVKKALAGLKSPRRPIGVFLFVGQTGVGKTELARTLARSLFGSEDRMVRIDCSEYALPHEYSKLIGSPPGYVGHGEGGVLTERLLSEPSSVVVFDEIEKAHRKLHNLLLQVFEEGMLTDGKGTQVSFREAIIILTSNVGADELASMDGAIGFKREHRSAAGHSLRARKTIKALEKVFLPEFLNRVDEVVIFRGLDDRNLMSILELMLDELAGRVRGLGLEVEFTGPARRFLVEKGTDPRYGARPLRRAIRRYVETPLADLVLGGTTETGDLIVVGRHRNGKRLKFNVRKTS